MRTFWIRTFWILAPLLCVCLGPAHGQASGIAGPVSGFLFDPDSRSILPILGVPGAAYLGTPIAANLRKVEVARAGNIALGWNEDSPVLLNPREPRTQFPIADNLLKNADRAQWSGDSRVLILSSADAGQIQRFTISDGVPNGSTPVDLAALGGRISLLQVDASGGMAVVGITGLEGTTLYRVGSQGETILLASISDPDLPVFSRDGRMLYLFNRVARQILSVDMTSRAPRAAPFLGTEDGISSDLAGFGLSRDGQRLFVASAGDQSVRIFDIPTHTLIFSLFLEFAPDAVNPLGENYFVLSGGAGKSLALLDLQNASPAVYFIPRGANQ